MVVRIRRVSKKADAVRLLIEILFFAILFFIAYNYVNKLIDFWIEEEDQGTLDTIYRLRVEMDNMVDNKTTVPIYIDKKRQIMLYPKHSSRMCEEDKSCICVCEYNSDCLGNDMKKCEVVEAQIAEEEILVPRYDKGKETVYNCEIQKVEKKIEIVC